MSAYNLHTISIQSPHISYSTSWKNLFKHQDNFSLVVTLVTSVTGLARLAGQILTSVHMGNRAVISAWLLSMWEISLRSVAEMNEMRPFKFHPGNRAGVFI